MTGTTRFTLLGPVKKSKRDKEREAAEAKRRLVTPVVVPNDTCLIKQGGGGRDCQGIR